MLTLRLPPSIGTQRDPDPEGEERMEVSGKSEWQQGSFLEADSLVTPDLLQQAPASPLSPQSTSFCSLPVLLQKCPSCHPSVSSPRAFRRLPPLPVLKQPSSDAPWLQPRQAAQMAWLTPKPSVGCCLTHLLPVQFHLLAESLLLRSPTMPTSTSACHMLKAKSGDGPSSSQAALPPPPRPPSHHSVLLRGTSPSRAQTVPGAWNSQRSAQ